MLDAILNSLRPALVLLNMEASRPSYEKHFRDGRIVDEIYLDRTSAKPSSVALARLKSDADVIKDSYEANPLFQAAVSRLNEIGISYEFGGQGDACGEFSVLRLKGNVECLAALEELAADDVGLIGELPRKAARERFRIFILRNYRDDWQENRLLNPDVGGSPYIDSQYWPKST